MPQLVRTRNGGRVEPEGSDRGDPGGDAERVENHSFRILTQRSASRSGPLYERLAFEPGHEDIVKEFVECGEDLESQAGSKNASGGLHNLCTLVPGSPASELFPIFCPDPSASGRFFPGADPLPAYQHTQSVIKKNIQVAIFRQTIHSSSTQRLKCQAANIFLL